MNKLIHLDCSLRDGGYYNNWDFNEKLINNYLQVLSNIGVDYCEIGFRFLKNAGFKDIRVTANSPRHRTVVALKP